MDPPWKSPQILCFGNGRTETCVEWCGLSLSHPERQGSRERLPARPHRDTVAGVVTPHGPTGPIIVGYDGSPKSRHALEQAAALLAPAPALIVVVWEPGGAFEAIEPGIEAAPVDIGAALEVDKAMSDRARAAAEEGARLAGELGFDAEGVAVADQLSVADTLLRLAEERQAAAIVVGTHGHKPVRDLLLGSTSRKLVGQAACPVVVVREPEPSAAGS